MKAHKPQHPSQTTASEIFPFPQQEQLTDFGKNASAFGERMLKLQHEGARFVGERFEDNMKTLQRLSACRSLPDLLAAQQRWFSETAQAYGKEWSRCADLVTETLKEGRRCQWPGQRQRPMID
jgi:hypothetical protein